MILDPATPIHEVRFVEMTASFTNSCLNNFLRNFRMNGVAKCVVGYCGGIEPDPTYDVMKDFTESVFIEFDPNVVTYEGILKEASLNFNVNKPNHVATLTGLSP